MNCVPSLRHFQKRVPHGDLVERRHHQVTFGRRNAARCPPENSPPGCRSLPLLPRCSSVEYPQGIFSLLAPCSNAKSLATRPFPIYEMGSGEK